MSQAVWALLVIVGSIKIIPNSEISVREFTIFGFFNYVPDRSWHEMG